MAGRAFTTLLEGGAFFESPRWRDGRWWVSDFYRQAVFSVTPEGAEIRELEVEGQPSGLGWMPDGTLLVVSMRDHLVLRRDSDGTVSVHADLSTVCTGLLNDLVVDTQGRAWVGDFGFDLYAFDAPATASLKRVDPDGTVTVAADQLIFPNGTVITPDGGTLIVGETLGNRYTSFTHRARRLAAATAPSGPSWARRSPSATPMSNLGAAPRGTRRLHARRRGPHLGRGRHRRPLHPRGPWRRRSSTRSGRRAASGVFACALGGDDGRTLLLCCAPDYFENNRREAREAVLLTTEVDVPHAGLP